MYYLLRTSTPASESWVFLTYTLLLFLVFIASRISRGTIMLSFTSLFSNKERDSIFYVGLTDVRSQVVMSVFCIFILALNFQLGAYRGGDFNISGMIYLSLIIIGILLIKYLLGRFLCYIFFNQGTFTIAFQHYQRLLIATSVILIPITLVSIYAAGVMPLLVHILYGLAIAFYLIALIIKNFMLFYTKKLALFYIFLYLCTVEILPLVCLILVAQKMAL